MPAVVIASSIGTNTSKRPATIRFRRVANLSYVVIIAQSGEDSIFALELAYGIDELTSMIFLLQRRVSRIQRLQEQMQYDRRGAAPVAQLAQAVVQREGYVRDLIPPVLETIRRQSGRIDLSRPTD